MGWVREILAANPLWANVSVGELHAVSMCGCGCRSIDLEIPAAPQNPRLAGTAGPIGHININTDDKNEARNLIEVTLYQQDGYLGSLDVIWYDFDNPMPETWVKVEHKVYTE